MSGEGYLATAFTPAVQALQEQAGSRKSYARAEQTMRNLRFTDKERAYLAVRDSFYLASVSETGWPYVQFRGGPPGFVRMVDDVTLGWADFRGNQQFITAGNVTVDDRVSLFFMDYPNRQRLKLFGHLVYSAVADAPELAAALTIPGYPAKVERAALVRLEGFSWNCPQYIPQKYTREEWASMADG